MPHIQITLIKGRTTEQKRRIAERMTDVLVQEAGVKRERVSLSLVEVEDDSVAEGGVLARDLRTPTAAKETK